MILILIQQFPTVSWMCCVCASDVFSFVSEDLNLVRSQGRRWPWHCHWDMLTKSKLVVKWISLVSKPETLCVPSNLQVSFRNFVYLMKSTNHSFNQYFFNHTNTCLSKCDSYWNHERKFKPNCSVFWGRVLDLWCFYFTVWVLIALNKE